MTKASGTHRICTKCNKPVLKKHWNRHPGSKKCKKDIPTYIKLTKI